MLYNNQTDAVDTFGETHAPGWATDYLFPNESGMRDGYVRDAEGNEVFKTKEEKERDHLAAWGGARILPSVLVDKDGNGEYSDPPVVDLTAAAG